MEHEPRPAIHMAKQLGWGAKLGGAESLGTSKVDQTDLQFISSVGGGGWFKKDNGLCFL